MLQNHGTAQRNIFLRQAFNRHIVVRIQNRAIQPALPRFMQKHRGQHHAHVRFLRKAVGEVSDTDTGF